MNTSFKILLIFTLLLSCSWSSFSQVSNNPFDIKNRPSKELIPADSPDSVFLQDQNIETPPSIETSSETNPFDVSHVPLQKETLRKKAKKKKTRSNESRTRSKSKKPSSVSDFKFWVILLSIILFAIIFSLNRKKISSLQRAVLNQNFQKSLARENNNGNNLFFLILYLLFTINIGLLFFNYIDYHQSIVNPNFKVYIYLTLIIMGLYLGRHFFLNFMGFVFPVHKETSIYSFSIKLFNAILGLFLLIINLLIVLGPENWRLYLIYGGFILLSIFYLFRLFNGTIHASRLASKHTFHFFLYLCTTEIAPLVIFYNLLVA